jgi:hypothetical protein
MIPLVNNTLEKHPLIKDVTHAIIGSINNLESNPFEQVSNNLKINIRIIGKRKTPNVLKLKYASENKPLFAFNSVLP